MRKIFLSIIVLFSVIYAGAEMQQGYTKTRGKLDAKGLLIPGQRLSGVIVETDRGKVTSESDGAFSLAIPNGNFLLKKVDLNGYILNDYEQLRQYSCSATPLALVLVKPDEYNTDKVEALRKINRTLRRTLQEREDEIDSLFEQQKISEQEKNALYQKLYADDQNSQKLVEEMAERYAKMDFDQIDEFQRQVTNLIINGELEKADSLLNTKGNIEEQIRENQQLKDANSKRQQEIEEEQEQLNKSKAYSAKIDEDLAARCYSKYEIYATKHKNDTAAYYLELRASIDTTNVEWQNEAGRFIEDYIADYEKAMEYYQRGLRHSESEKWQATFLNNIGGVYDIKGDYTKALEYYEKSLEIDLSLYGEQHPDVAISYNNIGHVYDNQGNYTNALEYYNKSLQIRLSIFGEQHPYIATSYNNIGLVYHNQGDYTKALEYYEKALEIRLSVFGDQHPDVARIYNNIGFVYHDQGNNANALEYYEKSLGIWLNVYGEQHPDVATIYNNIGSVYDSQGDHTKALEYYAKALEIQLSMFGVQHPDVAISYNNIGFVYYSKGDYSKALEYYAKALEIQLSIFGEQHPDVAKSYNNIGLTFYSQGDYTNALEFFEKALEIQLSILGEQHPDVATSYNNIGHVYGIQGDYAKALNYFEKALEIELNSGVQNARLATSYNNVGLAYYNLAIQLKYSGYQDLGIAGSALDIDPLKYIEHFNNKAVKNFEKSLEIQLSIFGEQSKEVMSTYEFLSTAYFNSGNYKKSLKFYEKYLKLYVTINGVINATAAELYNNIHYLYEILGNSEKAEECRLKAEEIKAALEQK